MKITYTSPNRSHHYPYAQALHRAGLLYAFVCGFSRLSPRAPLPEIGDKLKRHDFFQTLYLASLKFKASSRMVNMFNRLSNERLDEVSYAWAKESDVFIFYRTQGLQTTHRLKQEGASTLCVMEEVNSHIEFAGEILSAEYQRLGFKNERPKEFDYELRLKAYEVADYILCPSEFVRRSFIAQGFSSNRLIKVNYGFPAMVLSPTDVGKSNTFRLLYVGQLHYRKGLRYAIDAFKKLKHPKKEFVIVGPETDITGLENMSMPEGVIFTGPLKGDELKNQYKQATVFILSSLEDGFGLVVGEALSFGIPILITSSTGACDVVQEGVEGFIVPPGNSEPLWERLQQMADDKDLLVRMSAAALKTAGTLGSWDKVAGRLIAALTVSSKV
jgi:glycosyltransferase involved in cell wall biosynthesis